MLMADFEIFEERKTTLTHFFDDKLRDFVFWAAKKILDTSNNKHKVLICGNGGSAAESSHFATELLVRYKNNRKSIAAISLCSDGALMTAISNDFDDEYIFTRQIEGLGQKKDILFLLSTSGNSKNLISAAKCARKKGMFVIALLGRDGGELKEFCNAVFVDGLDDTAIIQEHQLILIHLISEMVEMQIKE